MTDKEMKKRIKQIIFKHLPPKEYQVFLYGQDDDKKA